jgi:hypothetical protein
MTLSIHPACSMSQSHETVPLNSDMCRRTFTFPTVLWYTVIRQQILRFLYVGIVLWNGATILRVMWLQVSISQKNLISCGISSSPKFASALVKLSTQRAKRVKSCCSKVYQVQSCCSKVYKVQSCYSKVYKVQSCCSKVYKVQSSSRKFYRVHSCSSQVHGVLSLLQQSTYVEYKVDAEKSIEY